MTGSLYCNSGKAEQGAEGKVGKIRDFPGDQDEGHHCHFRGVEQQF
jgi:hypothetical protein